MFIIKDCSASNNSRKSGIELLRIISMILIVLSHACAHGGFDFSSISSVFNRVFLQWGVLGNLGVDIFVLISGYCYYGKKVRVKSFCKLFTQVWFYSTSLAMISYLVFNYSFSFKNLLKVIFPTIFEQYWFFTAYVILMFFIPYLNIMIKNADRLVLKKFILIFLVLWIIIPTFSTMGMYGEGVPQFIFFYLVGAYFRKYPDTVFKSIKIRVSVTAVSLTFLFFITLAFELAGEFIPSLINKSLVFYGRDSLMIFGTAVGMFTCAIYGREYVNLFVNNISMCTFGVYLIHANPFFRGYLWGKLLDNSAYGNSPFLIVRILVSVIIVYICCSIIEFVRIKTIGPIMTVILERFCNSVVKKIRLNYINFLNKNNNKQKE